MSRDNRWLMASLFLWGVGEGLSLYFRPLYLKELGADPVEIGAILALAAAAAGITHIPAGYLADRFGRKQLLIAGWALGVVAALLMFLATTLQVFVVGLVAYMFTGFVLAPINAYVAEARGGQSIQRALTLVSASFWGGSLVSPAFGGLVARQFGLRPVFGLAVFAFVLSTLAVLPLKAQPLSHPEAGHTRYGPLFDNRRFLGFLALMFAALSALQLGIPFAPNFVVEALHFDLEAVGLLGTAASLGTVTLNVLLGQHIPRRGFMIAQALAMLYLTLLLSTGSLGWLGLAFFFQGSWNLARGMATAQVRRVVGSSELGLAFGLTETVTAVTLTFAPFAAGFLYKIAPALPFQVSLGLIAATLPLVWWLAPRRDAHTAEVTVESAPAAVE